MQCTQLFFQTTSDRGTLTSRRMTCELINALQHRDARTIRQTKRTVNIVSGEDHECGFHQLRVSKPRKLFDGESTQWVMECCRGSQKLIIRRRVSASNSAFWVFFSLAVRCLLKAWMMVLVNGGWLPGGLPGPVMTFGKMGEGTTPRDGPLKPREAESTLTLLDDDDDDITW